MDFIIRINWSDEEFCLCAYTGRDSVVRVPAGVNSIEPYAFATKNEPNTTITEIILPDSVFKIKANAFAHCRALKKVRWPKNEKFKLLMANIFEDCVSIESITIPESVTDIMRFMLPPNFHSLEFHDDLATIGQSGFIVKTNEGDDERRFFRNAETTIFLLSRENYKIIDGFMVNTKHKTALFHVYRNSKKVRIPDGIETIARQCFCEDDLQLGLDKNLFCSMKDELISNGLIEKESIIETERLENGLNTDELIKTSIPIEEVVIPPSVKLIRRMSFISCKKLRKITYEDKSMNPTIEKDAFSGCDLLGQPTDAKENHARPTGMRLERISLIHNEIMKCGFPSTNTLMRRCREYFGTEKISVSTITRDIEFMRSRMGAPIEYDSSKKVFFYTDKNYKPTLENLM